MSYEAAPATAMLATNCAVCRRPLLDSMSVEVGMGPTCRERHGYDAEVLTLAPEDRVRANVLINHIARNITSSVGSSIAAVEADIVALRLLGCHKVAERIEYRGKDAPKQVVHIRKSTRGTGYYVKAPFKPSTVAAWRSIPGRRWDADAKENFVPNGQRGALWAMLMACYHGCVLTTDTPAVSGRAIITDVGLVFEVAA